MKTKEELNALKEEVAALNAKLAKLSDEELAQVVGGTEFKFDFDDGSEEKEFRIYEGKVEKDFLNGEH